MMPTGNIYQALVDNGINIDTSVYKGGRQAGNVDYDYTEAYSTLFPYKASKYNINNQDTDGQITEYPIYTEMRYFWSFISIVRIFRMLRAKLHKHSLNENTERKENPKRLNLKSFFIKSPWKLDFNQATGSQLINALKRIRRKYESEDIIPIVLIGHSKTFVSYNERTLEKFLKWAEKQMDILKKEHRKM